MSSSSSHSVPVVTGSRMQRWFPGTAHPLVVSAPMAFVTNPALVCEVVRAGGFGFIQGGRTFKPDSRDLVLLEEELTEVKRLLLSSSGDNDNDSFSNKTDEGGTLPIGVGFVLFSPCAATHFGQTAVPILARHKPAAVWLFAPDTERPDTLRRVMEALRASSSSASSTARVEKNWNPKVAVQVGTVAAAREAAQLGADIIVAQGVDAGGHQFTRCGAGVVSLVPEVVDMLRDESASSGKGTEVKGREENIPAVWAAGGIADGRGVVAALALGAEGAVLGTRYMVATESDAQDYKRKALISTTDGGVNTVKSQLHDHVQGNYTWPAEYDARAIVHPSYLDHEAGVLSVADNEARYRKAKEEGDVSLMVTWSGSAVGLVKDVLPAAEITRRVRDEAVAVIRGLKGALE